MMEDVWRLQGGSAGVQLPPTLLTTLTNISWNPLASSQSDHIMDNPSWNIDHDHETLFLLAISDTNPSIDIYNSRS